MTMKKMIRVPVSQEAPRIDYRGGFDSIVYDYMEYIRPDTSLKSLISQLNRLQRKYRDRFQEMEFDTVRDCGCRYDCGCSPSYVLYGKRYETDVEYNFRLKQEARVKEEQDARERREYEKLKEKFEGVSNETNKDY